MDAPQKETPRERRERRERELQARRPHIDVTCTVARIYMDEDADTPAHVAAFAAIGEHGRDGQYHFPGEDGNVTVTVETVPYFVPGDPRPDEI